MKHPYTKARLTAIADLVAAGLVAPGQAPVLETVVQTYSMAITDSVVQTFEHPDPHCDPIGRQYLPSAAERDTRPDETGDPTGDTAHSPVEGIVHRYPDRALLKITTRCAVYCRFCFRREQVGSGPGTLSPGALSRALTYLRGHPQIREVILTGGDPLILSPRRLKAVLDAIEAIDHIEIIRLHSRIPVADPQRVTPALCAALTRGKAVYVCLHANHARELTESVRAACQSLHGAGCVLLSQSVLLKGVNDTPEALEDLFRRLVSFRVKPYYLHHLDRAPGTAAFRVSLEKGQELMRTLRGRLTGIGWPLYVLDIPGGYGKIPVCPSFVEHDPASAYTLLDPWGQRHPWEDVQA